MGSDGKTIFTDLPDQFDQLYGYGVILISTIIGVLVIGFIYFNLFYEIYTQSILTRAERLLDVCIDEKDCFLYVAVKCYQSGDESGPGFYIYRHYLFELSTGKKWIYKDKLTKREDGLALQYFNKVVGGGSLLEFKQRSVLQKGEYVIKIKPFKTWFDFGLEVGCIRNNKLLWRKKI